MSNTKVYQHNITITAPITLSLSESSASCELEKVLTKYQKTFLENIKSFSGIELSTCGANDKDNFQIFTPAFIVSDMVKAIGDDVLDFNKTILEPTSGDGAFTTYILQRRLETIKDDFAINILRALSTIYSVEMDKGLIEKQRSNIYTVITNFLQQQNLNASQDFLKLIRIIIVLNFIWGEFNTDIPKNSQEVSDSLFGYDDLPDSMKDILVFDMSRGGKSKNADVKFAVWQISDNKIQMHFEEVEI